MSTSAFPQTISSRDIQRSYKSIFTRVKRTQKPVVVISNNQPQAAIISLEMLDKFTQLQQEQDLWNTIEAIQAKNANKDPDEVYKDVTEAVEEVRQKMYEESLSRS